MKNIPEKFLNALKALINSDSKEAKRLAETLENEPEKSAERQAAVTKGRDQDAA